MCRLMRDWLAPSLVINSQTQCSLQSRRIQSAASRVGSASAARRGTGSFIGKACAEYRICAILHIVSWPRGSTAAADLDQLSESNFFPDFSVRGMFIAAPIEQEWIVGALQLTIGPKAAFFAGSPEEGEGDPKDLSQDIENAQFEKGNARKCKCPRTDFDAPSAHRADAVRYLKLQPAGAGPKPRLRTLAQASRRFPPAPDGRTHAYTTWLQPKGGRLPISWAREKRLRQFRA